MLATAMFTLESVIRGHHIYIAIWNPQLEEMLLVQREPIKDHDRHTVCCEVRVHRRSPSLSTIYRIMRHFLLCGGLIECQVTRKRKKGNGLEVPCVYFFTCKREKLVNKNEKLLASWTTDLQRLEQTLLLMTICKVHSPL